MEIHLKWKNHELFFTHKTVRSYGVAQCDYEEILYLYIYPITQSRFII